MKTNHLINKSVLLACLVALAAQPAVAGLKINLIFDETEPPPTPPTMVGGGNLKDIMEVAAKSWERVFNKGGSKWEITIEYGWGLPGAAYGQEKMEEQGGNPMRITRSRITFRNTPAGPHVYNWYADPTPKNNSEFTVYESTLAEIEDLDFNPLGELNVGRVLTGATRLAVGRVDLLTVAAHEIGHALGFDSLYAGHSNQISGTFITITAPRPFAGYFVPLSTGHADHLMAFAPLPLMVYDPEPGERQLITGIDALVISQFSSFDRPDLGEPSGVPKADEEP